MTECLVIPQDNRYPITMTQLDSVQDYQYAIGGDVEAIAIQASDIVLLADEARRAKRLPLNWRATCLWWLLISPTRSYDMVLGNAVLIGAANESGETSDALAALSALLLQARSYTIEVRFTENEAEWIATAATFSNFFEAAATALELLERVNPPEDVRVKAVS